MKHSLLFEGAKVIVAVSGGPDSLALLHFLHKESRLKKLTLIAAHVDHMLRGSESTADYEFVENYCKQLGIAFEGIKIDVAAYKELHHVSIQVAARDCRYNFFSDVMEKHGANLLAMAHHGDDQIETMIMRQIRGAFGYSLAGIPVKRPFQKGFIIRPFLCLAKADIHAYCEAENLLPRLDNSNFTNKYLRNRIRNDVLPVIKKENSNAHIRYQQQSEHLYDDEVLLEQLAEKEMQKVIFHKERKKIVLSIRKLNSIPIPLQRRGFQLILNYLYEGYIPEITTIHIEQFLLLMKNEHPSGELHFPKGLMISKSYDNCQISFYEKEVISSYEYQLSLPGIVTVKKGKIIAGVTMSPSNVQGKKHAILFDFENLKQPLIVRNRRPGDYISLQGMKGTKKLKSLFIDEKIPRQERDDWPVVVDGNGQIVWVPNLRRSNIALPTTETTKFVIFTYEINEV